MTCSAVALMRHRNKISYGSVIKYKNFNFLGASAKLAKATNSFAFVFAYLSVHPHETNFRVILYWSDLLTSVENSSSFARIGQNVTGAYFV
jgi:hypothetical protein